MEAALKDEDILLDEATLFADLRSRTGLSDLHEHGLDDRLHRLLRHLDKDLDLNAHGRKMAYETVLGLLTQRTQLLEDRNRHPGIASEKIVKPLVVTGLPRSGTTLLHALLAADPQNRAPLWWETQRPSPPPGISPVDDPRIAQVNREIAEMVALQPKLLQSHPYFDDGALTMAECESLGVLDFRHIFRSAFYRVPGVISIALNDDPLRFYEFHRNILQALQWQRPERRWALKGTEHHVRLEALKAVYPDAVVIWLHRDPQKVFPSIMELLTSLYEGFTGRPMDRPAYGRQMLERYKVMLDTAMASPMMDHPDVNHLLYADFAADPVGSIRAIYRRHDISFTPESEAAIRGWYDDPKNRGDRHGRFEYSIEAFGLTSEYLESLTADYRKRFNIPHEGKRA